jgi:diaminopimelate epimerase
VARTVRFAKWHGLGNDYLMIEEAALPAPLTVEAIRLICHRHYGVGSDGILLRTDPTGAVPGAVTRMRIFNPDGSEPEMCGNGIRIFARYLRATGAVDADEFVVETLAGPIRPRLLAGRRVRVDMGAARFSSANIAVDQAEPPEGAGVAGAGGGEGGSGAAGDVVGWTLRADAADHVFTFVDVGNPHCVIPLPEDVDLAEFPLAELGPVIEHLPLFPNRVNVEFIQRQPDGSVSMRVWERGVGETNACGTGATAVGAAVVRLGLAESPVRVHLLGGDLEIEVGEGGGVVMTGPAEEVFTGELSAELLNRLGWAGPGEAGTKEG